ncbi:3-deoxy-8-phosphooctulonate synthase [Candidatus Contubernalis alkaliaceticus]|uniref:3-deoxy-8-phosphooctulonate synthase n=1 Tax=Candidatus Contubernalis alkaliaceticus TaxID=338645 RepID=UPI001F4BD3F4|nr:3-deoxy-8-phosphooctulonate synthase [Candidatus Contubernalis alkalaceticus]UNC93552.1 3-deoxy-8-phosphooctulonate synthase [Candidatus Contubernalis alkalaceticus]
MKRRHVNIGNSTFGGNKTFTLIAGPCSIESEMLVMETAHRLKEITDDLGIPFVFKSSYDKANRTSFSSFRGPGIEKGLEILGKVKRQLNVDITTDIHLPQQAAEVASVVDLIQIPALLCRQTDLIETVAKTNKPMSVKKGQFLAPWDMTYVVNKALECGNEKVILIERGTTFGYNNLVVDMTSLIEMANIGYPVVFDGTHSVQKPGGNGSFTGGNSEYVSYLCRAAVAIGIDGLFLEVHPSPDKALCDGSNMIKLDDVAVLLQQLKFIDNLVKGFKRN